MAKQSGVKATTQKLEVFFARAEDYKIIAANGIWGGVTPRGDVYVDFFVEKNDYPEKLVLEIKAGGKPASQKQRVDKGLLRECQFGVLLSPKEAISIGEFLVERGKQAKEFLLTLELEKTVEKQEKNRKVKK